MFLKIVLGVLFCSFALVAAGNSYEGFKIYDINAMNAFEKDVLLRLSSNENYDFFALPKILGTAARVMIQPEDQIELETLLTKFGIDFIVINENVGKSIELERVENEFLRSVSNTSSRISFTYYQRYNEILSNLDELAASYPDQVSVTTIAKTYEQRDMKIITISNGDGKENKKVILIDAGIHGREWIGPAAALYIIHQLVENFSENSHLLKDYNWIILPVANPDGYEYTHTWYRMWRKTRKPSGIICRGTDVNRNFGFHWGEVGASSFPCSDTFKGSKAFSEPETQALHDLMLSTSGTTKLYLTLHSTSQMLLFPFGHTTEHLDNYDELYGIGQKSINALSRRYNLGSFSEVLYLAAGTSADYAYGAANIPIVFTMELPAGSSGYDPKPSEIEPIVQDSWNGIKAMAEEVISRY